MARVSCLKLSIMIGLVGQFDPAAAGAGGEYVSSISSRHKVAMMRNAIESTRQVESQKMVEVDRKVQDISATSLDSDTVQLDDESVHNAWGVIAPLDSVTNGEQGPIWKPR